MGGLLYSASNYLTDSAHEQHTNFVYYALICNCLEKIMLELISGYRICTVIHLKCAIHSWFYE